MRPTGASWRSSARVGLAGTSGRHQSPLFWAWLLHAAVLALCAATISTARATEPESVPLSVTSVATGGYWQQQERGGPVRAVVHTLGFEALASQLTVEWLAEPTLPSEPATVAGLAKLEHPLGAPGVFSVSVQALRPGCVEVRVTGQISAEGGTQWRRSVSRKWWALQPGQLQPQHDEKGRPLAPPPSCRVRTR